MTSQGAIVKLDGWTRQSIPEAEEEFAVLRGFIVEAVRMLYAVNKMSAPSPLKPQPVSLAMIYKAVKNHVEALIMLHKWQYFGFINEHGETVMRTKRTIDRLVNHAASPKYQAKIVSVKAGYYLPNEAKEEWK